MKGRVIEIVDYDPNWKTIFAAEKVALASLNYIIEKKEWKQDDVTPIFHEHDKILEAYRKALLGMWD